MEDAVSKPPKTHIALNTSEFDQSVAFYRAFLGREPVKHKPGYAKFELDSPGLNLTLNERESVERGGLNHLGIQLETERELREARERLEAAGFTLRDETNVDCCYALQDKFWVKDPDGRPWEIFRVKVADTAPELSVGDRPAGEPCCAS